MTRTQESWRHLAGWSGSLLVHVIALIFGFSIFVRPVRVNGKTGKSSTEMELTLELVPPVVTPPAAPRPEALPVPQPKTYPPLAQPLLKLEPNRQAHQPASRQTILTKSSDFSKGATDAQPDDLHNDPPVYPEESQQAHEEGLVVLRVDVDKSGKPVNVSVFRSSGYFRLDLAARHAVQHWKFHPATTSGGPIRSEVNTPVRFKLQSNHG